MARDVLRAEPRAEARRDALGHLARVDEYQRRPVLANELADALVDLVPLLVRTDRGKERRGDLDSEIQLAQVPGIDERALASGADEEVADVFQRFLGRGESDALKGRADERLQPFERQRQVRPTLVAGKGVDLVD